MKKEEFKDFTKYIVTDENEHQSVYSMLKKEDQTIEYFITFTEEVDEKSKITTYRYSGSGDLIEKGVLSLINGIEVKFIIYDENLEMSYYIEYENYPSGETMYERRYNKNGEMTHEEFFEDE